MVKEAYVSFETAKLLKEKGFDEMTYLAYGYDNGIFRNDLPISYYRNSEIGKYKYSCPTQQMAMRWLREIHNIFICIASVHNIFDASINYEWQTYNKNYDVTGDSETFFKTYEECVEVAIKYCLENLI